MSSESELVVEDLVKRFGNLTVLDELNFEISEGRIAGIIGPNGAGKSTLFNTITGIYNPDGGHIYFRDSDITSDSPPKIAARGIGRTFQTPRVFGGMDVRDNLAFSSRNQIGETMFGAVFRESDTATQEEEIQDDADEVLKLLDIEHLEDSYARELSGGQRKLLELGRVLMIDPDLIMLDEPTVGINPSLQETLIERLYELNDEGKTIVMVEHNMDVVMNHCEDVIVIHNGQVLTEGSPEEIQQNNEVIEAYLGGI